MWRPAPANAGVAAWHGRPRIFECGGAARAGAPGERADGDPVVSVDTKKKDLVGDFHNGGREWRPKGEPEKVRMHDFKDAELGKAIPYGVYDVGADAGWVSMGVDHDTASFAAPHPANRAPRGALRQ